MLSCQTGRCKACFILFLGVVCPFLISRVKIIIWRELCLLRLLADCDFDWFHSNLNKQRDVNFGLCHVCERKLVSGLTVCRNSPSAHKYCLEIMQLQGPHTLWTNIHHFTQQYSTPSGCIWYVEACNPLKWVIQHNNHMNVRNIFVHTETTTEKKTLFTLPLVLRKELNHCTRGQVDWTSCLLKSEGVFYM